jgi:hypothetical protein
MAFRPGYHNREELPSKPKPHRAISAEVSEIRKIIAAIQTEFPWYGPTENNLKSIFDFLWEHDAKFNLESVRVAVTVLVNTLDRVPPPPPPPLPPVPTEPEEVLQPGQLSIKATKQDLQKASPDQIRNYLKRVREAEKK